MVGKLLVRGMLVGIVAGLVAFAFARVFGEPQIDRAIALEEMAAQAAGEAAEPELVTRATQAGLGLLTALVTYGAAIGGLFSLVFAYVYGRVSDFGPRGTSALLALGAFIAIVLVPDIKYPATPPAVGNPETIGERTTLFFIMLVLSLAVMVTAVGLARRLWASQGPWNASFIAAAAFIAVIAIAQYALPAINEVPQGFPADLLWNFRIASLGIHAVLWAVIGLAFGAVSEHGLVGRDSRSPGTRSLAR